MINVKMSSFTYGAIVMQPGVPEKFTSRSIAGSEASWAEGPYGSIFFQEMHAGELLLRYSTFQLREDLAIDFRYSSGTPHAHIALKNDSLYYIRGLGDVYLAEGQFNIIDTPDLEGTYYLEKDNEYHTLHIVFSAGFVDQLLPVFHDIREWLRPGSAHPKPLFRIHTWLSAHMQECLEKIIHAQYPDMVQGFYREAKIREWLCEIFSANTGQPPGTSRLNRHTSLLIQDAKRLLDNSYGRHITLSEIARQTGMNEFRLKAAFKQFFGISMFDYLIKIRMLAARELLLETNKPIKEIARITGYATKQSFLNAFKKYFKNTPGAFRKG